MKITEQELELRRERILNTAFDLFCRNGIEQVSLSDIAKRAHVGNSTIYRYFTNKPMLVMETLSVLWKAIGERLEVSIEETDHFEKLTGYEQLSIRLEGWKQLYRDNADYVLFSYEAKLYLLRNAVKIGKAEYEDLMEHIKAPSIATLKKGQADGTIPVDKDPEDLFYAIWGTIRGYIVKIVIYQALCGTASPWESRYPVMEQGILCAIHSGWKTPAADLFGPKQDDTGAGAP